MKPLRHAILIASTASLMTAATMAQASPQRVDFGISSVSFIIGDGYGTDAAEKEGTLLDVRFTYLFSGDLSFSLAGIDDGRSLDLASVTFREENSHGGIREEETDNLGVSATFVFTNPLGLSRTVSANAKATTGSVSDSHLDYALTWTAVDVNFGDGGVFRISLDDLMFDGMGTQTQRARISLLSLPTPPAPADAEPVTPVGAEDPSGTGTQNTAVIAVPEPASLALLGLGLAGLGALRRRQNKA